MRIVITDDTIGIYNDSIRRMELPDYKPDAY